MEAFVYGDILKVYLCKEDARGRRDLGGFFSTPYFQDNSGQMTAASLFICSPAVHTGDQRTSSLVGATRQSPRRNCCFLFGYYQQAVGFLCFCVRSSSG